MCMCHAWALRLQRYFVRPTLRYFARPDALSARAHAACAQGAHTMHGGRGRACVRWHHACGPLAGS
jgi:hypothetical protein